MPLTDFKIRQTKPCPAGKSIKLTDGAGLYIEIKPSGSKLWRYRYRLDGRENIYAIGDYPRISLADARAERDFAREHVRSGRNPAHVRKVEKAQQIAADNNTFKAVSQEYVRVMLKDRKETYRKQFERAFEHDVYPKIGRIPIRQVTSANILEIINKMCERDAKTLALQVRQWISAVFRYAASTLRADSDPAAVLKNSIKRNPINHSRAISHEEIRRLHAAIDSYGGYKGTAIALRLLCLLFVRTIELRYSTWSEFDFERKVWVIPAERMKMKREHLVPLSRQAIELLLELRKFTAGKYLFPGMKNPHQPISATTLNRAIEYLGIEDFHCHDFRATASTYLYDSSLWRSEVIERQLAHAGKNKSVSAYNHAEYLSERQEMMQFWADQLDVVRSGAAIHS